MTIEKLSERNEWVEGEFKKWQENFIIPFNEEFEVKSILDLQWQYNHADDNHIKTKSEILFTISRAKRELGLKPKPKTETIEGKGVTVRDGHGRTTMTISADSVQLFGTDIKHSIYSFRDMIIEKIKEINAKAIAENRYDNVVTRLNYKFEGIDDYVEDYSPYTNEKYMSKKLREALLNHTTLTFKQKRELDTYVIDKNYN